MTAKPSAQDIKAALSVFDYYHQLPDQKSDAKDNADLASLFAIARKVVAPTKEEIKALRNATKQAKRKADHELLNESLIRVNRNQKLVGQNISGSFVELDRPPKLGSIKNNDEFIEQELNSIRAAMQSKISIDTSAPREKLNFHRSCHICGEKFNQLDRFYDQLCPLCATFNHMKRVNCTDMTGKVVLLTGARVKIGYCVALKLLRMNATVIVTTRFNLGVTADSHTMQQIDAIINNAAQTVRRPPAYYAHLIPNENTPVSQVVLDVVEVVDSHKSALGYEFKSQISNNSDNSLLAINTPTPSLMSQAQLIPSDSDSKAFPPGLYDRDDQQIDTRTENSWTQSLTEITTVEMIECHAINTFAPWVIISELTPLLRKTAQVPRFIVNVSAMEGQFYRNKSPNHPHTNMAKAALNQLTRTSSGALSKESIYMTCVDTGWITDEKPVEQWAKREAPPPLDEIDAAARILDPIIQGLKGEEFMWGVFLKNYFPTRW